VITLIQGESWAFTDLQPWCVQRDRLNVPAHRANRIDRGVEGDPPDCAAGETLVTNTTGNRGLATGGHGRHSTGMVAE